MMNLLNSDLTDLQFVKQNAVKCIKEWPQKKETGNNDHCEEDIFRNEAKTEPVLRLALQWNIPTGTITQWMRR